MTRHGSTGLKNGPGVNVRSSRDTVLWKCCFLLEREVIKYMVISRCFLRKQKHPSYLIPAHGDTSVSSDAQALQGGSQGVPPESLQSVLGLSWGPELWSQICRCRFSSEVLHTLKTAPVLKVQAKRANNTLSPRSSGKVQWFKLEPLQPLAVPQNFDHQIMNRTGDKGQLRVERDCPAISRGPLAPYS